MSFFTSYTFNGDNLQIPVLVGFAFAFLLHWFSQGIRLMKAFLTTRQTDIKFDEE